MVDIRLLALAGALALVWTFPVAAHEAVDVYVASLRHSAPSAAARRPLDLVATARRHVGAHAQELGLPNSLWCADFVNRVRREVGLRAVPSRLARDQVTGGRRVVEPHPGVVVIVSRRGGAAAAHTGVVADVLANGDIVVISGNSGVRDRRGRRVTEAVYPRSRVIAFVDPNG